jgi:hypothetical protein
VKIKSKSKVYSGDTSTKNICQQTHSIEKRMEKYILSKEREKGNKKKSKS